MTTTDPFGAATDDPFAAAPERSDDFLRMTDLVVSANLDGTLVGRLILFTPESLLRNIQSDQVDAKTGKMGTYDALIGTVVVLDGPVSDKIPQVPFLAEDFWVAGRGIVPKLLAIHPAAGPVVGEVDKYHVEHRNPKQPMVVGRLVKDRRGKAGNLGWYLDPPQPADVDRARAYVAAHPVVVTDPFA